LESPGMRRSGTRSLLRFQNSLAPTLPVPSQEAPRGLVNRLCSSIAMFRSLRVLLLDVISPSQRRCSDSGARS
jgi:hypothetical protein